MGISFESAEALGLTNNNWSIYSILFISVAIGLALLVYYFLYIKKKNLKK